MTILVEAAVESLEAALAAAGGGAHRIELCADLTAGGTTPDVKLLRECVSRVTIPIFVLVRPRAGDFVYTSAEHRSMLDQIACAKEAGAHGIVSGALSDWLLIEESATAELRDASRPLPFTFHRAFDGCIDLASGLERLIHLGVDRVLTSGGARTAPEGTERIRRLVDQAKGRIEILPGGGIDPSNVARLVQATAVKEVHFSVRERNKVVDVIRALKDP